MLVSLGSRYSTVSPVFGFIRTARSLCMPRSTSRSSADTIHLFVLPNAVRRSVGWRVFQLGTADGWAAHHSVLLRQPPRLKNCTARSCFWAAARVLKVPRLRRLPVFGLILRE